MNLSERDNLIVLFEKYHKLLTQTQKQVFQLYYFEDLSLKEISDIVVSTRSGVFDALKKAKKKLHDLEDKLNS